MACQKEAELRLARMSANGEEQEQVAGVLPDDDDDEELLELVELLAYEASQQDSQLHSMVLQAEALMAG